MSIYILWSDLQDTLLQEEKWIKWYVLYATIYFKKVCAYVCICFFFSSGRTIL